MNIWKGANVLITGGGSGIGRALAIETAKRGANVVVTDVSKEGAAETAALCTGSARAVPLDVCDAQAFGEIVDSIVANDGGVDFLFNNAGIGISGEVQELSLPHWNRIIDVNIHGVIHGIHACYPHMVKRGRGHIINTASMAGLGPAPLLTPYAMTKHAVVGLSTSLRIEAQPLGVRVSVLCPAAIETPILDQENPTDLRPLSWNLDLRRFLTRLGGPPCSLDRFTREALAGIERNRPVIVIPARARLGWWIGRLRPAVVERMFAGAVAFERAEGRKQAAPSQGE